MSSVRFADLSAQVDGINNAFTLPEDALPSSVAVFVNGVRITPDEYSFQTVKTFTLGGSANYPTPLLAHETLQVTYGVLLTAGLVGSASNVDPALC